MRLPQGIVDSYSTGPAIYDIYTKIVLEDWEDSIVDEKFAIRNVYDKKDVDKL